MATSHESTKGLLRDTPYATELARGAASLDKEGEARIERLVIKSKQEEAVRFSWWVGGLMARRPLDLTEDQLIDLFNSALSEGVFTAEFRAKLKEIL